MPTKRKTEPTESAIVKQIAKFLESMGAKVLKTSGSSTGLLIGTPDVFACVPVRVYADNDRPGCYFESETVAAPLPRSLFLALEVKRPSNRKGVTVAQHKQLIEWRAAGALAGVVTSVDDVRELLGLARSDA